MSITVLGSSNVDHVLRVGRRPGPGETLLVDHAATFPGGKGNNQAIAVARSGGRCRFVTALGSDSGAAMLARTLLDSGVDLLARRVPEQTGSAVVTITPDGENSIIVAPGANATLRHLDEAEIDAVRECDALLLQLETPLAASLQAARAAGEAGRLVVLNAAPFIDLPDALIAMVDVLVVNKHEAELLGRQLVASPDDLGAVLNRRGTALIVTLGPKGAAIHVDGTQVNIPGFPVDAVDTTGAGDTFCGVLATELAASGTLRLGVAALEHAVRYGCAAAALAVQAHGAVTSIPDRADIDAFLDKHVPPSVER